MCLQRSVAHPRSQDADSSRYGELQRADLEVLVVKLWKAIGRPMPTSYQQRVPKVVDDTLQQYCTRAGAASINFGEFLEMLSHTPWRVLLPPAEREELTMERLRYHGLCGDRTWYRRIDHNEWAIFLPPRPLACKTSPTPRSRLWKPKPSRTYDTTTRNRHISGLPPEGAALTLCASRQNLKTSRELNTAFVELSWN